MSYYDILNVSKNATFDDVKKQYKKLALKHHPDRGGDPEMFKKISEAYQTLSDPEKKRAYDNPNPFSGNMPGGFHFSHTSHNQYENFVDPNIIFQQFFNNEFFREQPNVNIQIPRARNTTTFNVRTTQNGVMGTNIFQKSVSTKIDGTTKTETTTEIKNGVKTQTVRKTNLRTGEIVTNVKQIAC